MTRGKLLLAGVAAAAILLAGVLVLRERGAGPPQAPVAGAPAPQTVQASQPAPAGCLLPGPAPVLPEGRIASAAEMKAGHDRIQGFVLQLEAYQACRIAQADHAGPGVTSKAKQAWLDQGDGAVDQVNALAQAFAAQLAAFRQLHPGQ